MPAEFIARTFSSRRPGSRFSSRYGVSQPLNDAPSSEHSNCASGSFEVNSNVANVFVVGLFGVSVIVVSGAVIVHA